MKKILALLLLCGVAQVQALTVKNNSSVTIKVSMDGDATGQQNYVLKAGQVTPSITFRPGQVDYIKVDKFLDFATATVPEIKKLCGHKIECIGTDVGVVLEQLGIYKRDSNHSILNGDNFVFTAPNRLTK